MRIDNRQVVQIPGFPKWGDFLLGIVARDRDHGSHVGPGNRHDPDAGTEELPLPVPARSRGHVFPEQPDKGSYHYRSVNIHV